MLDARTLKRSARELLPDGSKKLALIHAGVALGATLIVSLLSFCLNQQMNDTGGLSGLGTRTILATIQMVLQYAVNLGLPFWEIGFLYAALKMARGQRTGVPDLAEGFRRFGAVLRLQITQGLLYLGVGVACAYAGALIFSITPWAIPLAERIMPMMDGVTSMEQMQEVIASIPAEEMQKLTLPLLAIGGALFAVLAVFLFYRFRMAEFIVMDKPGMGGMAALIVSGRMTKGHRLQLLRLDLSFWWFYVLTGISAAIMYADTLLGLLAVELPVSADMAWILSCVAGCLFQLVVYWQSSSYVKTTYAAAYEDLLHQPLEQPKPQPVPKNLPWDEYEVQE